MKIVIGDDDEQAVNDLAEQFSSDYVKKNGEGFDAYFKHDEIKLMGLKDPNATFPNGSRMTILQDNQKYMMSVQVASGQLREYEIDAETKSVKRNGQDCSSEETVNVIKMLAYMMKHCSVDNSETRTIKFEKKGVI